MHEHAGGVDLVGVQVAGLDQPSTSAMVTRPAIAASGLKLRAVLLNTRLPCRSPFQARPARSRRRWPPPGRSRQAPKRRTSLAGRRSRRRRASYFQGRPPSATWVPTPVAAERRDPRAAGPEPLGEGALGVSSTSSSPPRYWRANSLFSRRTTPPCGGCDPRRADVPGPSRRGRSCSTPPRGRRPRGRAAPRSAPTGSADAESAGGQRGSAPDVGHRFGSRPHNLVHCSCLQA